MVNNVVDTAVASRGSNVVYRRFTSFKVTYTSCTVMRSLRCAMLGYINFSCIGVHCA